MTQQLWAPWRMEYIKRIGTDDCVFCQAAQPNANKAKLHILAVRPTEYVIINKYPYTFGHILVCPTQHVSTIEDLCPSAQLSLFQLVVDAQLAIKNILHPHGLNIGINIGKQAGAGIDSHIHFHIVPRWEGDTNFMPTIADCHIMPGHLDTLYHQLRKEFCRLETP